MTTSLGLALQEKKLFSRLWEGVCTQAVHSRGPPRPGPTKCKMWTLQKHEQSHFSRSKSPRSSQPSKPKSSHSDSANLSLKNCTPLSDRPIPVQSQFLEPGEAWIARPREPGTPSDTSSFCSKVVSEQGLEDMPPTPTQTHEFLTP